MLRYVYQGDEMKATKIMLIDDGDQLQFFQVLDGYAVRLEGTVLLAAEIIDGKQSGDVYEVDVIGNRAWIGDELLDTDDALAIYATGYTDSEIEAMDAEDKAFETMGVYAYHGVSEKDF